MLDSSARRQVDIRVLSLHLYKLLAQLENLVLQVLLLHFNFQLVVLGIGQVMDHYLVFIVLILELEDVVSGLLLILFRLLQNVERVHVLAHLFLSNLLL